MTGLHQWMRRDLPKVSRALERSIRSDKLANTRDGFNMAGKEAVHGVLDQLLGALFPGVLGSETLQGRDLALYLEDRLRDIGENLCPQVESVLNYQSARSERSVRPNRSRSEKAVQGLIDQLPAIRKLLLTDLQAGYEGDPAAISLEEVLMSYPCVEAIATYRLANPLYKAGIPLIPRIMTERAHSRTGIDIHPGASIGPYFFIDHGTGVVIGETTVIGKRVKLYQGVTLGALSFPKDEHGRLIKGIKRHPNIEDDVTIYAGATVLGGETTIGRNSVIGGSCWLTTSVPPNTIVLSESPRSRIKK